MVRERQRGTPRGRPDRASLAAEARLGAFLSRPSHPEGTLSLGEVRGFLFAVVAAPDLVKPSEWLPVIFGDAEPSFESRDEAEDVMNVFMSLYNEASEQVQGKRGPLPRGCDFLDDPLANLEPDAPVSQWARGFLTGHLWLQETWHAHLSEEEGDEMAAALAVLTFFSSRRLAEGSTREMKGDGTSVESVARKFRQYFSTAAAEYADRGQLIWRAVLEARAEQAGPTLTEPQVGRNEPCPCGSGEKFKRCCGRSMH